MTVEDRILKFARLVLYELFKKMALFGKAEYRIVVWCWYRI